MRTIIENGSIFCFENWETIVNLGNRSPTHIGEELQINMKYEYTINSPEMTTCGNAAYLAIIREVINPLSPMAHTYVTLEVHTTVLLEIRTLHWPIETLS